MVMQLKTLDTPKELPCTNFTVLAPSIYAESRITTTDRKPQKGNRNQKNY